MLDVIRHNIRNKLLLLLTSVLCVIIIAIYSGLVSINTVIKDYSASVNSDVTLLTQVSALNVKFKTQVQEWKNTLIRGKDEEQREKYWGRFVENGKTIQQDYKAILSKMEPSNPAYPFLLDFSETYPPMLAAYEVGYKTFMDSGFQIDLADASVKGIDRAPTQSLTKAVEQANQFIVSLKSEIEESASNAFFYTNLILIITIIGTIVLITWFIDSRILTPLNRVTELSKRIAAGDFTGEIKLSTKDQIGQVAVNFRAIQNDLSHVIQGIIDDINHLGTIVTELVSDIDTVKHSLEKQIEQTQLVDSSIEQLSNIGHQIDQATDKSAELVEKSSADAHEGIDTVSKNVEISESMMQATNSASEIVSTLKVDSDSIGNVVDVINGIAEQTNLLALNAAIEAARAGESGRGFAVVADEVRTLANKTQQSTKLISESVGKLQYAADQAVTAMGLGKEHANKSLYQAKLSKEMIEEFTSSFENISRLNKEVNAAVSEQVRQNQRVGEGISTIVTLGQDSQLEADDMAVKSTQLNELFNNIVDSVSKFKLKQ